MRSCLIMNISFKQKLLFVLFTVCEIFSSNSKIIINNQVRCCQQIITLCFSSILYSWSNEINHFQLHASLKVQNWFAKVDAKSFLDNLDVSITHFYKKNKMLTREKWLKNLYWRDKTASGAKMSKQSTVDLLQSGPS